MFTSILFLQVGCLGEIVEGDVVESEEAVLAETAALSNALRITPTPVVLGAGFQVTASGLRSFRTYRLEVLSPEGMVVRGVSLSSVRSGQLEIGAGEVTVAGSYRAQIRLVRSRDRRLVASLDFDVGPAAPLPPDPTDPPPGPGPVPVTLAWDAPTARLDGSPFTEVSGYLLYVDSAAPVDGQGGSAFALGNVTQFQVPLGQGTYFIAVRALDTLGQSSSFSNIVTLEVP
ncbi:MAG: hypothetical protein ACKVPX_03745 [Myxococcaceae bacterium]